MSEKVFEQIREGMDEALEYAQRENRIPDTLVLKAIEVVIAHLDQEWISEGCETDHAFGCGSCQAVFLKKQLEGLAGCLPPSEGDAP